MTPVNWYAIFSPGYWFCLEMEHEWGILEPWTARQKKSCAINVCSCELHKTLSYLIRCWQRVQLESTATIYQCHPPRPWPSSGGCMDHCQILQLLLAVLLRPQNPSIRRHLLLVLGGLGRQTRFGRVQVFRYHVATAQNAPGAKSGLCLKEGLS